MMEHNIFDAVNRIKSLRWAGKVGRGVCVGLGGITEIVCERVPGQEAHVPWFSIWVESTLVARWNGAYVEVVTYFTPADYGSD